MPNRLTLPNDSRRAAAVDGVVAAYVDLVRILGSARAPEFLDVDLTMAQLKVLMLLGAAGEMRMSDMAALLGVSLSTATGHIDRLVEAGYAVRRDDLADRRQVFVSASRSGIGLIDRLQDLNSSRLRELLSRLDESELAHIGRSVELLAAAAARGPLGEPAADRTGEPT